MRIIHIKLKYYKEDFFEGIAGYIQPWAPGETSDLFIKSLKIFDLYLDSSKLLI